MNSALAADPAATRLCAACGMCCDGVLFHAVVLQPGDSPRALAALGLKLKHHHGETSFRQPCSAHADGCCTIYAQRPARCRQFVCRQLLRVESGEIPESAALATILATRSRIDEVTALMDRLAETNPRRALAPRVANALTGAPDAPAAELRAAMRDLDTLLTRDFRVASP